MEEEEQLNFHESQEDMFQEEEPFTVEDQNYVEEPEGEDLPGCDHQAEPEPEISFSEVHETNCFPLFQHC